MAEELSMYAKRYTNKKGQEKIEVLLSLDEAKRVVEVSSADLVEGIKAAIGDVPPDVPVTPTSSSGRLDGLKLLFDEFEDPGHQSRDRGSRSSSRYWWVNQGKQFAYERQTGCVFAPSGGPWRSWSNVGQLAKGDFLIHYSDQQIKAVGVVSGDSRLDKRPSVSLDVPASKRPAGFEEIGHLTPVDYYDLTHPISKTEIDQEWRTPDFGPFNKNGDLINQGGAYRLDDRFVEMLRERFADRLPDVFLRFHKVEPPGA